MILAKQTLDLSEETYLLLVVSSAHYFNATLFAFRDFDLELKGARLRLSPWLTLSGRLLRGTKRWQL